MGTAFLSCDWGTSSFRLRLVAAGPPLSVLAEMESGQGIAAFPARDAEAFRRHLVASVDEILDRAGECFGEVPVYLSGMITSSIGWKELPYARLPFSLDGADAVLATDAVQTRHGQSDLLFISGVRSHDDVMRGEESELIGLFSDPELEQCRRTCVAILPGTHSKAVLIEDGAVRSFRTHLTGELFRLLGTASVLRHSVQVDAAADAGSALYLRGIADARETGLIGALFRVRTNDLLHRTPAADNASYLAGLLIGAELESVLRAFATADTILVAGTPQLQDRYVKALAWMNPPHRIVAVEPEAARLAASYGHCAIRRRFRAANTEP